MNEIISSFIIQIRVIGQVSIYIRGVVSFRVKYHKFRESQVSLDR